jgi:hypothetical protein
MPDSLAFSNREDLLSLLRSESSSLGDSRTFMPPDQPRHLELESVRANTFRAFGEMLERASVVSRAWA